jgi:hypothetical protein
LTAISDSTPAAAPAPRMVTLSVSARPPARRRRRHRRPS